MKSTLHRFPALLFISVFVLASCSCRETLPGKAPREKTLRRSESFFGIHFDFHASKNDSAIGKTFSAEMIDSMLTMVQPDYIQVDCKGHAGISSYPTKVGTPAPGFVRDPMKIWREVTRKHKVALFVHYSGVLDAEAAAKHPRWTAINSKGEKYFGRMSVKGLYVDSLLIPQMEELIDKYHIDGCWVDGECWALWPDYRPQMRQDFRNETGFQKIPKSFSDPGGYEFFEYNRKAFRRYIEHYTDKLHRYNPEFQITSNWAFSSLMPEPVDVNIDFLSGDFSPDNSVFSGLYESRCIAPQGKPWDLMAWSFTFDPPTGTMITKSAVQLEQLAATVISMGGGYQVYFQQNRDASPRPWQFGLMKEVAQFCRERQPFCKGTVPVPQIALLYSTEDYKKNSGVLYMNSPFNDRIKGILKILLNGQNSVEILMEHHLKGRMQEYPLIVIPECNFLSDGFKTDLLDYVKNGGKLLVIGSKTTELFANQLNVELLDSAMVLNQFLPSENELAGIHTSFQPVVLKKGTEYCGLRYQLPDFRFASAPAASVTCYGKGKIAGVYFDIAKPYLEKDNPVCRDFINSIVDKLFPAPLIKVEGSDNVVVTVNKLGEKLAVNLINISGDHANEKVARYDEIPVIGPLTVKIRMETPPKRVVLQPENKRLHFSFSNGIAKTTVKQLGIHSIIMVE